MSRLSQEPDNRQLVAHGPRTAREFVIEQLKKSASMLGTQWERALRVPVSIDVALPAPPDRLQFLGLDSQDSNFESGGQVRKARKRLLRAAHLLCDLDKPQLCPTVPFPNHPEVQDLSIRETLLADVEFHADPLGLASGEILSGIVYTIDEGLGDGTVMSHRYDGGGACASDSGLPSAPKHLTSSVDVLAFRLNAIAAALSRIADSQPELVKRFEHAALLMDPEYRLRSAILPVRVSGHDVGGVGVLSVCEAGALSELLPLFMAQAQEALGPLFVALWLLDHPGSTLPPDEGGTKVLEIVEAALSAASKVADDALVAGNQGKSVARHERRSVAIKRVRDVVEHVLRLALGACELAQRKTPGVIHSLAMGRRHRDSILGIAQQVGKAVDRKFWPKDGETRQRGLNAALDLVTTSLTHGWSIVKRAHVDASGKASDCLFFFPPGSDPHASLAGRLVRPVAWRHLAIEAVLRWPTSTVRA